MKNKSIKKWTIGVCFILTFLGIVSCVGIKSQIKQHTGGKTEVVDTSLFNPITTPIGIINVSVLSPDCTEMLDGMTVLVEKGEIKAVGKDIKIPTNYKVIDGSGQFLIPGLIDTHAHLQRSKNDLLLYLSNGVTSMAELFGHERHLKWRTDAQNEALSPNLFVTTRKLGSQKGFMPKVRSWFGARVNYTSVRQARRAVIKFKKKGYDALKLSSFLNTEIYDAIIDEAQKQKIPAIGHLSTSVGLDHFYTSGQSQLAHVEEVVKNLQVSYGGVNSSNAEDFLKYVESQADSISIKIKQKNVPVGTTLYVMESLPKQMFQCEQFMQEIELEYANPGQVEGSSLAKGWLPGNNHYQKLNDFTDPETQKLFEIYWNAFVKAIHIVTKAMIKNDVTLLVGTDANATGIVAGFSLHDELTSLINVGMSNTQALRSSTSLAAEWMKLKAGKIKIGYKADLVLLKKNPLEDINNTRSINAVISNGKYLNRAQLDKMLQAVKDANNRSRKVNIDEYVAK